VEQANFCFKFIKEIILEKREASFYSTHPKDLAHGKRKRQGEMQLFVLSLMHCYSYQPFSVFANK